MRCQCCNQSNTSNIYGIIRNIQSSLVLDAAETKVKLQEFNKGQSQLWTFKKNANDSYQLINVGNGKALDIENNKMEAKVITQDKHNESSQKWTYNKDDQTIQNLGSDLVLDIDYGKLTPGSDIITYSKHGLANQKFCVEYQSFES